MTLEFVALDPGAAFDLGEAGAMVLAFVISGDGRFAQGEWKTHTAIRLDGADRLTLTAASSAELLLITVPRL